MREGNVVVSDIVKEMYFIFLEKQTCGDGVNGSVTPALVEEAAVLIKGLEKVEVGL